MSKHKPTEAEISGKHIAGFSPEFNQAREIWAEVAIQCYNPGPEQKKYCTRKEIPARTNMVQKFAEQAYVSTKQGEDGYSQLKTMARLVLNPLIAGVQGESDKSKIPQDINYTVGEINKALLNKKLGIELSVRQDETSPNIYRIMVTDTNTHKETLLYTSDVTNVQVHRF